MDVSAIQSKLKKLLQDEPQSIRLENLAAALIGRLMGVTIAVAKTGFQHGGDAGPAGRQGRHLRIECKKYGDNTALSDRELLGEIDQALSRDSALEAWVLVATRSVPEQLEQSLSQKGESIGVPVIILDWKPNGLSSLAALCAFAPDLVATIFSIEAGELARQLSAVSVEAIERLRRDLQAWCLGYQTLRDQSHELLEKIWQSPRISAAALGQNVAGGNERHKIRRRTVYEALDAWWGGPALDDAPAAVVGWDGVGKTWATVDWLMERRETLPILLVIPSSAVAGLTAASETSVKRFLADRLYELAGMRDRDHWLHRLDNLLKRPKGEGPVFLVFFDGLNQEPSVPWLPLLKTLQGESFEYRVRVMVSTRIHDYETKLGALRSLIVSAVRVPVDVYDRDVGGELEQMLAFEGLTQAELHPDLIELACTPRLFRLVVKFRERLVEAGQVTIHRLLWEYGRDTLGTRAGRSFSEDEWRAWLQEIAQQLREGVQLFSLKKLGETASRADLSTHEVYARLSDIIDGRFVIRGLSGEFQLQPIIVHHALGAALLTHLDAVPSSTFELVNAELSQWLDPIAGLDQRAEILRAAVSIVVERGEAPPITGVLVTAWLQTQNVTDAHRLELTRLADNLCEALLDTVEHSTERTHASARLWAIHALRSIPRSNDIVFAKIVARARRWLSIVSRDVQVLGNVNEDHEKHRSEHFIKRIGRDTSGSLRVLGQDLQLVDSDNGALGAVVPSILEGFPLAGATPTFEAAAIAMAVHYRSSIFWDGLKWLCLLNERDTVETSEALRRLSNQVLKRLPEAGIHSALPARVAALLLWMTGVESDEDNAVEIDPGIDRHLSYEKDYLPQPSRSWFALERRHAADALKDADLRIILRIQCTSDLWIDPTFTPSNPFVEEVLNFAALVEVEKLFCHMSKTAEDHNFEVLAPVLARCAPECLYDLICRKLKSYRTCSSESRYWNAIQATDYFILAGEPEREAVQALRTSVIAPMDSNEAHTVSRLLLLEIYQLGFFDQARTIIESGLAYISTDFCEILRKPTVNDVESLIARYEGDSASKRRDLLCLLAHTEIPFSDVAWSWFIGIAFSSETELHGLAYLGLAELGSARFGRELFTRSWGWSPTADFWVNHYGTGALVDGTAEIPFEQLVPHLAPWRLLEAARRRGSDPGEIRLAANVFSEVLVAKQVVVPDLGATLFADCTDNVAGTYRLSATTKGTEDDCDDPLSAWTSSQDIETRIKELNRVTETAVKRIREARISGAKLYLTHIDPKDFEEVLIHAPDLIGDWLEGANDLTSDFRHRVQLAESVYLALCETLLRHDANKGVALWRSIKQVITTRFMGSANVDELIHMAFRAPDTPSVANLCEELLGRCHNDKDLLEVAIAATVSGKTDWLAKIVEDDKASSFMWRRKRGIVLQGFQSHNTLPVQDAWPAGEVKTGYRSLIHRSARFSYSEACAYHWWRYYLAAPDSCQAYAAWVLFLRSADRRAWSWISTEVQAADDSTDFFDKKITHAMLNYSKIKRAMEKNEKELDKEFLGCKIVDGVGPWVRQYS